MQHIEAALDVEEASLSQIHRTVGKQISRLQLEERMLKMLQERLLNEAGMTHEEAAKFVASGAVGMKEQMPLFEEEKETSDGDVGPSYKLNKSTKLKGKGGAIAADGGPEGTQKGPPKKRKT